MAVDITNNEILTNDAMVSQAFNDLFARYANEKPRLGEIDISTYGWIDAAPAAKEVTTFFEYEAPGNTNSITEIPTPDEFANIDASVALGDVVASGVAAPVNLEVEDETNTGIDLKGRVVIPDLLEIAPEVLGDPAVPADYLAVLENIRDYLAIHVYTKKDGTDADYKLRHILQFGDVIKTLDLVGNVVKVLAVPKHVSAIPLDTNETVKFVLYDYSYLLGPPVEGVFAGWTAAGGLKLSFSKVNLAKYPNP